MNNNDPDLNILVQFSARFAHELDACSSESKAHLEECIKSIKAQLGRDRLDFHDIENWKELFEGTVVLVSVFSWMCSNHEDANTLFEFFQNAMICGDCSDG